jgi:hypothetical protein
MRALLVVLVLCGCTERALELTGDLAGVDQAQPVDLGLCSCPMTPPKTGEVCCNPTLGPPLHGTLTCEWPASHCAVACVCAGRDPPFRWKCAPCE